MSETKPTPESRDAARRFMYTQGLVPYGESLETALANWADSRVAQAVKEARETWLREEACAYCEDMARRGESVGVDSSEAIRECMPGCQTVGPHDMCTKWMSGGPLGETKEGWNSHGMFCPCGETKEKA